MDRAALARLIDHTLLAPEATDAQVEHHCTEAAELGVGAVCVSPSRLPVAVATLANGVALVAVVGFPTGAHRPLVKAAEAVDALADGADEIDMVIDLGLAAADDWAGVEAEVAAVRTEVPEPHLLKVIVESAWLGTDARIVDACRAAVAGGADFVKTSTGFHAAGGATTASVALMAATVGAGVGVKASGGIRDTATALAMVGAGATRLGCSASRTILEGC